MITVLFADLRGYTILADSSPPEVLLNLLNHYMSVATDVIQGVEGTVNDLLGDGILAFFGAPVMHVDDARRAVVAALELQKAVANMALPELPGARLQTGIGISTGEAIAGNIGSERRMHYTVIGAPVNLAARLQIAAAAGQILTDEKTHSIVKDFVISQDMGTLGFAGRGESLQVFKIIGLNTPATE